MRYLFFDIECCNGRDICEFGYVLTDTNFQVTEKKNIPMNPDKGFELSGRGDDTGIKLFYTEEQYQACPTFPAFYEEIKALITAPEQIIVGHAISNDAGFIRIACQRYNLPPIDFSFSDTQRMYREFYHCDYSIALDKAVETLQIEQADFLHKSDDDSLLTMRVAQAMCKAAACTLEQFIVRCPSCTGKSVNFEIAYDDFEEQFHKRYLSLQDGTAGETWSANMYRRFLEGVQPQGKQLPSAVRGKKVCFSGLFEKKRMKDAMSIIQILYNQGGTVDRFASQCTCFVYDPACSEGEDDTRFQCVQMRLQKGKKVDVYTVEAFCDLLHVTKEDLQNMPFPEESVFLRGKGKGGKAPVRHVEYREKNKTPTLADLLRLQGITLPTDEKKDDEDNP